MKCYVVDAFTDTVFKGNPAAVCVMKNWLPDSLMQDIARENNLSETAFTVRNGEFYDLLSSMRYFYRKVVRTSDKARRFECLTKKQQELVYQ